MAESSSAPLFAGRYRFQPVGHDWDVGRSGYTHLVFDTKNERWRVIKRAEIKSQQAVEGLKNEVGALLDLKGFGVPEVYDTGEAEYGSKNYFYMVIEYIKGIRVEKNLDTLSAMERAEILTQLFGLLAKAHQMGIANGDVDLKHLFWLKDKQQLVVIDWGNAKLHVHPKDKTQFAFDLARSAEIIYFLITAKGYLPASGSLALPKDSGLLPGLVPVPYEFRELCKWAPRVPTNTTAPCSAQELFEVSKQWGRAIYNKRPYKGPSQESRGINLFLLFAAIVLLALEVFLAFFNGREVILSFLSIPTPATVTMPSVTAKNPTTTATAQLSETPSPTGTLTATQTPTLPTQSTLSITATLATAVVPAPAAPGEIIQAFDKNNSATSGCWTQKANSRADLQRSEGFTKRRDGNWRFGIEKNRTTNESVETDFSKCIDPAQVKSVAINMWVPRLELQRDYAEIKEPGKEIGFFSEGANGQRREYTVWIDATESMHLRVREGDDVTLDEVVSIVNLGILKIRGVYPRFYAEFPIQMFFEINNNGLDIIYLKQGPVQQAAKAEAIDPTQMIRIDEAIRPTLGAIEKIGLIGYGGETQTVIWPLVFFSNKE